MFFSQFQEENSIIVYRRYRGEGQSLHFQIIFIFIFSIIAMFVAIKVVDVLKPYILTKID